MMTVYDPSSHFVTTRPLHPVPPPVTGPVGGGGGGVFPGPLWWRPPPSREGGPAPPGELTWQAPVFDIAQEIADRILTIDQDREDAFETMLVASSVSIAVAVDGGELEKHVAASLGVFAEKQKRKKRKE